MSVRSSAIAVAAATACLAACGDDEARRPPPPGPPPIVDADGRVPDLVCPQSPGCESSAGALVLGAAARPITPIVETWTDTNENGRQDGAEPFEDANGNGAWDGVWLAGFGQGRAATRVHDDIWARVLVVRKGDVAIGLVALDLVGFFHDDVVRIRLAAAEAGLDLDHVLVSTTHTHGAPDTMGIWGESVAVTGYDEAYVSGTIVARTVEALAEANATATPVAARVAVTQAPALVNDTREPRVVDQALSVVQFRAVAGGSPVATAVFWGNHPEALGSSNTELTSDYPHFLRDEIEARYPASVALFFSGSLGGLSTPIGIVGCPAPGGGETCPQGTWERAEYVGRGAAVAAAAALEGPGAIDLGPEALDLSVSRNAFLMTTTNGALALAFWFGLLPRKLFWIDTGKPLTPEEVDALSPQDLTTQVAALQTEVNLVRLGPIAIAAVPGELYPELWLARPRGGGYVEHPPGGDYPDAPAETPIQAMLGGAAVPIVVNNANDALGYLIPKPQWDQALPYAYGQVDEPQYGEQNSLGPDAGATIVGEFSAMTSGK